MWLTPYSIQGTRCSTCRDRATMGLRIAHQKLKELLQLFGKETRDGLMSLPGIGGETADKLLAKRSQAAGQGTTLRLVDVMAIEGIGAAKLSKITGEANTKHVIKYATHYTRQYGDKYPVSILSVDVGILNSAYALLDSSLMLHNWTKVNLGMPKPYSPATCCENVQEAMKSFPSADMIVVEAQSHRNPAMAGFLGISIELRILEAFVYAVASTSLSTHVQSVEAKMVAQYFGISAGKSLAKKKAAIEVVNRLLCEKDNRTPMGNEVTISDQFKANFWKEKKKDDLSDCLLQAIAVFEWGQMARDL